MLCKHLVVLAGAQQMEGNHKAAGKETVGVAAAKEASVAKQVVKILEGVVHEAVNPGHTVGADGEGFAGKHALYHAKLNVALLFGSLSVADDRC